jgi:hypothetical protein
MRWKFLFIASVATSYPFTLAMPGPDPSGRPTEKGPKSPHK